MLYLLQALADFLESAAGAVLVDTKFNLDEVWRIFKPLLSPIATPESLELPPMRELTELCDSHGYSKKETCIIKNDIVHAHLRLQLNDVLLVGDGYDRNRKAAKGKAASHLLKELEVCSTYAVMLIVHMFLPRKNQLSLNISNSHKIKILKDFLILRLLYFEGLSQFL